MKLSARGKTWRVSSRLASVSALIGVVQACSPLDQDLFRKDASAGNTGSGGRATGLAGAPSAGGSDAAAGQSGGVDTSAQGSGTGGQAPTAGASAQSAGATGSTKPSGGEFGAGGVTASAGGATGVNVSGGRPAADGGASTVRGGSGSDANAGEGGGSETGGAEICDGLDNDGNGIVDDVDAGGDGICDCLRVATLGSRGAWGSGYFVSDWLKPRAPHATFAALRDQVLTREKLAAYDVVFALNTSQKELGRAYTSDEADAVTAWVKGGGGFMSLSGFSDSGEATNVNVLLAGFGLHYESAQIFSKGGGTLSLPVTTFSTHPITAGVSALGIDNGHEPLGNGTVYATKEQVNIGIAREFGEGHVALWADEWVSYAEQWQDRAEYNVPRFWLNALRWLTPSGVCQVPSRTGG